MRSWIFNPFLFYPALAAAAFGLILISLGARTMPPEAEPHARLADGALVIEGRGLAAALPDPAQVTFIVRDGDGAPTALRLAVQPARGAPTEQERGVRIPLPRDLAEPLAGRALRVTVSVRPQPITTAAQLAVSVQGAGPAQWVANNLTEEAGILVYTVPASVGPPAAVGLRVVSAYDDYLYGAEIVSISLTPTPISAAQVGGAAAPEQGS